jgi:hypothetical protein
MGQVLEAPPHEAEDHHHHEHDVAVAVITPAGIYPSEDELRRVPGTEVIETTLKAAAEKLHLTNTSDWVARVHDRKINAQRTYREEHLSGIVEIHWHKHEGGGGA